MRSLRKAGSSGDQQSRQLTRLSGKMGNQQMGKAGGAEGVRDRLLQFIAARLARNHAVQQKELAALGEEREWFRGVAHGRTNAWIPEPTRWHEAARLFKEAADALCRGHLEQGAQKLEKALGAEEGAYKALPKYVLDQLEGPDQSSAPAPAELPHALNAGVLPPCAAPQGIEIADRILAINDYMERSPPRRKHRAHHWWEEEEEEDEEKKDEKKDKKESVEGPESAAPTARAEEARAPDEAVLVQPKERQTELADERPEPAKPRTRRGSRRADD